MALTTAVNLALLANNIGLHYTLDQFTNNGGEDGSGDGTITSVSPPMSIGIGLKAFPCPASELLFVQLPTGQRSTFMVSDLSGAYTMSGYLDSVRPTVPVGALPNGTYILSVGDGAGQRSTRFVVIH